MFIFYTKIIDIVLRRTIFRGIGAYSRMFVYCAIWCVLECIFRERSLKKIYMITKVITTWTPAWGQSWPLPHPLCKKSTFFLKGGLFLHVGTSLPIFCHLFFMCMGGGMLFGLASPPYENFCGRPCSGIVGNLSYGTLSWHYGHISYR